MTMIYVEHLFKIYNIKGQEDYLFRRGKEVEMN